jgi:hypothetical protein
LRHGVQGGMVLTTIRSGDERLRERKDLEKR